MGRPTQFEGTGVVLFLSCFLLKFVTILPLLTTSSIFCDGLSSVATRTRTTTKITNDDKDLVKEQLGYLPLNYHSVTARTSRDGSPVAIKTYPLLRKKKKTKTSNKNNDENNEPLTLSLLSSGVCAPFPTQYWLTNPEIGRAIGEIERRGYIGWIEDYLNLECNLSRRRQLWYCHEQSGVDRWELLTPGDRQFFVDHGDTHSTVARMKDILCNSGIAGTAYRVVVEGDDDDDNNNDQEEGGSLGEVSIKCLHTHYAHFRSTTTTNIRGSSREENDDLGGRLLTANHSQDNNENPIGRIVHHLLETKFPTLDL